MYANMYLKAKEGKNMEFRKRIKIRLEPQDEYMHPVEEAENFNESMYFNIFDARDAPFGGWFRIGNRPNEGYAEMTCCIYLSDGNVGFMFSRPNISNNDAFDAGPGKEGGLHGYLVRVPQVRSPAHSRILAFAVLPNDDEIDVPSGLSA